jgi:predicted RNA-binding protein with TRAM domain
MNNVKKGLSLFLAALFVMVSTLVAAPVKAEETANVVLPTINLAVVEHNPIFVGETQSFYVTSDYEGQVQYRAWLKQDDGSWVALTDGYSEAVDAATPYKINSEVEYKSGDNVVVLWVKRAGEDAANKKTHPTFGEVEWDNYYIVNMAKATKFDAEKDMKAENISITTNGTKVTVSGEGAFRINAKNLATGEYETIVTDYTKKTVERTLSAGKYIIYAHAVKAVEEGKAYTTSDYDAWKLAVVELEETATTVEVFNTELVPGATVGSKVKVEMTEAGKAEYTNAAKFQVYLDGEAHSAVSTLGEATIVYPAVAEGDEVTIKLLDEDGAVVLTAPVKVGEAYSIEKTTEVPVVDGDYKVTALLVPGATVGCKIKVEAAGE